MSGKAFLIYWNTGTQLRRLINQIFASELKWITVAIMLFRYDFQILIVWLSTLIIRSIKSNNFLILAACSWILNFFAERKQQWIGVIELQSIFTVNLNTATTSNPDGAYIRRHLRCSCQYPTDLHSVNTPPPWESVKYPTENLLLYLNFVNSAVNRNYFKFIM